MIGSVGREPNPDLFPREYEFLHVQCGDFVAIKSSQDNWGEWWVGQVLNRVGSSLDSRINTIFQVIDVDTGRVKIINADLVVGIIKTNNLKRE